MGNGSHLVFKFENWHSNPVWLMYMLQWLQSVTSKRLIRMRGEDWAAMTAGVVCRTNTFPERENKYLSCCVGHRSELSAYIVLSKIVNYILVVQLLCFISKLSLSVMRRNGWRMKKSQQSRTTKDHNGAEKKPGVWQCKTFKQICVVATRLRRYLRTISSGCFPNLLICPRFCSLAGEWSNV